MKPEEAINQIKNLIKGREDPRGKTELDFALDMAIDALHENESLAKTVNEASELLRKQRLQGEWIRSLLQTLVDNGCITAIQANHILKEGEKE